MDLFIGLLFFATATVSMLVRFSGQQKNDLKSAWYNFEAVLIIPLIVFGLVKMFYGNFLITFLIVIWVFPVVYSWPQSDLQRNNIYRRQRYTHCFRCKSPLASSTNYNCFNCGWISCPNCGACGCIYNQFR